MRTEESINHSDPHWVKRLLAVGRLGKVKSELAIGEDAMELACVLADALSDESFSQRCPLVCQHYGDLGFDRQVRLIRSWAELIHRFLQEAAGPRPPADVGAGTRLDDQGRRFTRLSALLASLCVEFKAATLQDLDERHAAQLQHAFLKLFTNHAASEVLYPGLPDRRAYRWIEAQHRALQYCHMRRDPPDVARILALLRKIVDLSPRISCIEDRAAARDVQLFWFNVLDDSAREGVDLDFDHPTREPPKLESRAMW